MSRTNTRVNQKNVSEHKEYGSALNKL